MGQQLDFIITEDVQRIEMWTVVGARAGFDVATINQMADLFRRAVLVPVCGMAIQTIGTDGFDPDGFMHQQGAFRFKAVGDIGRLVSGGWLPEQHGRSVEIAVNVGTVSVQQTVSAGSLFSIDVPLDIPLGTPGEVRIALSSSFVPAALPGGSPDTRNLGCIMQSFYFS